MDVNIFNIYIYIYIINNNQIIIIILSFGINND